MRNEYIIDWSLLKKWTNESLYRGEHRGYFIRWCALSLLFLALGLGAVAVYMHLEAVAFLMLALFGFYRAFFRNIVITKQQYKRFAQIYGKPSWVRTICFDDDGIAVKEEKTETKYNYSDILEIVEKGEMIFLKLQAETVVRLYKSKFVDCTWEECREKILLNNPDANKGLPQKKTRKIKSSIIFLYIILGLPLPLSAASILASVMSLASIGRMDAPQAVIVVAIITMVLAATYSIPYEVSLFLAIWKKKINVFTILPVIHLVLTGIFMFLWGYLPQVL